MPSINLIWEQRALRQRNQSVATALLLVVVAAFGFMAWQVVNTDLKRRACQAGIRQCDERISVARPLADRNEELQGQIAALEPMLALLQEAQRITLRWVNLLGELDRCVPDPRRVAFNQCVFSPGQTASGEKSETSDLIGTVTLSGMARGYPLVSQTMRRLAAQRHVGDVRVTQAQRDEETKIIRFTVRAQFRVPPDEEQVIAAALKAQSRRRQRAILLSKADEETVVNRLQPKEMAAR